MPKPKIVLNAQRAPENLVPALAAAGFDADLLPARDGLERTAREAVAQGARLLVAGGGDGTVSAVAGVVADTDCTLGVLPLGTFNNFARDLGIPLDIESAARVLAAGRTAAIDAAEVNGRLFINNSSIGLYPWLVELREQQERRGWSRGLALLWAALPLLRRYRLVHVRLNLDGKELARRTPFVFVGNNVYRMEGLRALRRDSISDGTLSLAVAHHPSRAGLIRLALHALAGRLRDAGDFDLVTATEIRIETPRATARVSLDGEVVRMKTPLHYRIRTGALRVIVPEE